MFDWKKKAEEIAEKKRKESEEAEKLKEIKRKDEELAKAQIVQDEYNRRLVNLQRKFKCHVCGRVPTKPSYSPGGEESIGYGIVVPTGGTTDWNRPGGMSQCIICGNFVCYEPEEHIHAGVCQKCAGG